MESIFWILVSLIAYHLLGYPLILLIIGQKKKTKVSCEITNYSKITVLCPAYNEEKHIEEKIQSFLELNYPNDKIEMIIISDDSTDRTNEIVRKFEKKHNIRLVIQKPRKGKPSGHNLVESELNSDFIVSTDANSIFHPEAINELVKTITSNPKIGIVSGCLRLQKSNAQESGEGSYWKYESLIKQLESNLFSIIGSNGSLYIIRRELFGQIHPASVDDFERTLQVLVKNKIGKYQSRAIVYEEATERPTEELKRKIRIISREWFSLKRNIVLLNPFKYPKISFILFSHKILRWLIGFLSLGVFISSLSLLSQLFFRIFCIVMGFVIITGFIELLLERFGKSIKPFKFCAYFTAMNYAAILAFIKFLFGKQLTTWNTIRNVKG